MTNLVNFQYGTETSLTLTSLVSLADGSLWKSASLAIGDPGDTEVEVSFSVQVGTIPAAGGSLIWFVARQNANGDIEAGVTAGPGADSSGVALKTRTLTGPIASYSLVDADDNVDVEASFVIPPEAVSDDILIVFYNNTGGALHATGTNNYIRYRGRSQEVQ